MVPASGRTARAAPLSVAPMMDISDRHFRYLVRQITSKTLLYSEMITAQAVLNGDTATLLARSPGEGSVVLQLGGDDPEQLARAAELGARFGYQELNLNVGCPSPRVQSGNFGACLMSRPGLVGRSVAAMARASGLPVGVKHRIGVDERDAYDDMLEFVDGVVEAAGGACARFVVHARKAWLHGLSPKENRSVPPLRHELVHRLKAERPELTIETNGGILDLPSAARQLAHVDGVMIGRAVHEDPSVLAGADALIDDPLRRAGTELLEPAARLSVGAAAVIGVLPYVDAELARGTPLTAITRHLLGLFRGLPGARGWRRELTEGARLPGQGSNLVRGALERLVDAAGRGLALAGQPGEELASDDQVLDLVGAFADAR